MLNLSNVSVFYKQNQALRNVSMNVYEGEIVAIVGANGAGKSTMLNCISRLVKHKEGALKFRSEDIDDWSCEKAVKQGIVLVPEGRLIFTRLTVEENLDMGAYTRRGSGVKADREMVLEMFPVLGKKLRESAGLMSGGEQQMLSIGRALMAGPKLLMMDEPSMGLAPIIVKRIFSVISKEILEAGVTILLVEQNAVAALPITNRGYVLERGKMILEDSGPALLENKMLQNAYIG